MKNFFIIIIFSTLFLFIDTLYLDTRLKNDKDDEIRFIYISYLEYLNNFKGNSVSINKSKIDKMIDNISINKFNAIFLQASPFSDAIYDSTIFPYSYTLTGAEGKNPGFDYLEYFIKKAHSKKIKIHAWINPYRISSKNDVSLLDKRNPAIEFIDTENIGISEKGIYYDPSSQDVKTLIKNQVLELIKKYNIDGIHFDDYFYVDYNIDKKEYEEYVSSGNNITLSEFRLMHTNDLIKQVSDLIKKNNKNIIFSISPDGNINNNYNYHYADIRKWIEDEMIDIIMPQLYYGFDNQYLSFEEAYNNWQKIIVEKDSNVKMIPVLAFYKVGFLDNNAGTGKEEWLKNGIIEKQIKFLMNKYDYIGYGLFRYDFLFNDDVSNSVGIRELSNIRNLCK